MIRSPVASQAQIETMLSVGVRGCVSKIWCDVWVYRHLKPKPAVQTAVVTRNRSRRLLGGFLLSGLCLLSSVQTAELYGAVADPSRAGLADAIITATNLNPV